MSPTNHQYASSSSFLSVVKKTRWTPVEPGPLDILDGILFPLYHLDQDWREFWFVDDLAMRIRCLIDRRCAAR